MIQQLARIFVFNALLMTFVLPGINVTFKKFFNSDNTYIYNFGIIGSIGLFMLLLILEISWVYVLFMNPGKLPSEISKRGIDRISHFQPCKKCFLPKPPRCHHCSRCGSCILFMDHHCEAIGTCLGYRNFKVFILVLFYGSITCLYGALILISAIFLTSGSRITQFFLAAFLIGLSIGLHFFGDVYIKHNRNNTTTIENIYPMLNEKPNLPHINLLDKGIWKFIPTPPHIDPYLYLE
ncbi:hypothetical protein TRFO_02703 [Tritrichomonas foetus]|uniref:Palmitoyltransferase n=1 Tax=Tritrichomonas foetus TaxID=1144522 RepID=A0A1J4KYW1_9EUKA|nr:hypothetical protein TRFO_02703 [Tritrichomonas foetus]|eukprot:OHT16443.1 hypothetical protein TRFO_02703 [Tritrichomonas foetus]